MKSLAKGCNAVKFLRAASRESCVRLSFVFMLLGIAGCNGDGLSRVVVSGAVSFQGVPIEDGQIRFVGLTSMLAGIILLMIFQ